MSWQLRLFLQDALLAGRGAIASYLCLKGKYIRRKPLPVGGRVVVEPMRVSVIPGGELSEDLVRRWRELQLGNPDLGSACFSPEFTQAVAAVRHDVEVAVVEEDDGPVAFFPYQRSAPQVAIQVGGIVSDFHGVISSADFSFSPLELIRKCGLLVWDFDNLPVSQRSFEPYFDDFYEAPVMDLSEGYVAYAAERRTAGTEQIKKCGNLARRLELEVGPVRFVPQSNDLHVLERVLDWKSEQYRHSGWEDLFATAWGRGLVEHVHATTADSFTGMLSLLYSGDKLVAGHIGMRSQTRWNYWFPAYDPAFAKYSPGIILLLKMAEHAPSLGVQFIDLGKGPGLYKQRLMNASIKLVDGAVEQISWLWLKRRAHVTARRFARRMRRVRMLRANASAPDESLI